MNLRALHAFLAFHRRGTVAGAAAEVHLSAAAVSVQLKLLEEELGVPLFRRTKRTLALSADGIRLIPIAEKMLSVQAELLSFADPKSLQGKLSVGSVNSVLLGIFPAVIQQFKRENPKLEMKVFGGASSELLAKLQAGMLDAIVINTSPDPLPSDLVVHHLYKEPIALMQSVRTKFGSVEDAMSRSDYIALDRNTWFGRSIEKWLAAQGINVTPAMELSSQPAVLAAVRFGLGVSILPIIHGADATSLSGVSYTKIPGFERTVTLIERQGHIKSHLIAQLKNAISTVAQSH